MITSTVAHLLSIDNIECLNSGSDLNEYYIEAVLQFVYELKDGGKTTETINAIIEVTALEDVVYSVENAYRADEDDIESEI